MPTFDDVAAALNRAVDNGYDEVIFEPVREVAADLVRYDTDFEDCTVGEIAPLVLRWQEENR